MRHLIIRKPFYTRQLPLQLLEGTHAHVHINRHTYLLPPEDGSNGDDSEELDTNQCHKKNYYDKDGAIGDVVPFFLSL